jgi:hypothetical protein
MAYQRLLSQGLQPSNAVAAFHDCAVSRVITSFLNVLAIPFSIIALVAELFMLPLVKTLPETASFWSFWSLLVLVLGCAMMGILIGAHSFRQERSKAGLAGFLLSELALMLIVLYGLAQWLTD